MSAAREMSHPPGSTDSWFTGLDLWLPWHSEARYTVDVAGHAEAPVSQAIGRWWDIDTDGLAQDWAGERVWCNPPYSDIPPWVDRATRAMREGCELVDMLVPANRTEQPWWQRHIEPVRDRGAFFGIELRSQFIPRRRRFGFPGDATGESSTQQSRFGLVLLRWRRS